MPITPEVPATAIYWVIAGLMALAAILFAVTAWFASRLAMKVDTFPREVATIHKRISESEKEVVRHDERIKGIEKGHDNLERDFGEHLKDYH